MAGFLIVMMTLFMMFMSLMIYIINISTLIYLISCIKKITKLKIRDNELKERIFELKTKNL